MRTSTALLLAGDLACFLVFSLIGLRSHDEGIGPASVARVAGPFALSWAVAAGLTGTYRARREPGSAGTVLLLRTWLPAWMGGLLLRAILFGRSPFTAFSVIALLFNGLLLVAWHLGIGVAARRGPSAGATADSASSR